MDKHISLARELGYEGQELRDYLKRQQDLEREERLPQREYEMEKREADQKEKDRKLEKLRIEAEKMKTEAARKDKDKEMEMEKLKIEAETTSHPWGPKEKSSNPRSPKLPYFDEHTDKMDSYLTGFESYAMSNKWDPSMWASYLSALLKGRA